jgi:hypothetical protein
MYEKFVDDLFKIVLDPIFPPLQNNNNQQLQNQSEENCFFKIKYKIK